MPQEGARLGSEDAPVTIQVFNDVQCADCREDFLSDDPGAGRKLRPARRRASSSTATTRTAKTTIEFGFYGAEAAAEQGYGWQYIYLFFRNQEEADRFGVTEAENRARPAGKLPRLGRRRGRGTERPRMGRRPGRSRQRPASTIEERLEQHEELGSKLGIRFGQAMIVERPERQPRRCRKARP